MYLIIGLGNPGKEYEKTRHNLGFEVVGEIARHHHAKFSTKRSLRASVARIKVGDDEVILAMPQTYMNLSGEAARQIIKNSPVAVENIIVVHDEMDLPEGAVKLKKGGGAAGHKGLESMIASLGTKDFIRIRIGIGRPEGENADKAGYVLSRSSKESRKQFEQAIKFAANASESIIVDGIGKAMNAFNKSDI